MNRLRVVNLGLPKSGTTTLGRALKLAGLKVADYRIRPRQTENTALHHRFVGDLVYRGYFQTGDPLALMAEFDGFAEINVLRHDHCLWPQTDWGVIDAIRQHHPGVRFLASRRPAFDMSQSMVKWDNMGIERVPKYNIPGLPKTYGKTTAERVQWIEAHYAHLRKLFENADDFLEFQVGDSGAPKQVGDFLGRDLPWWGHINSAADKAYV